MDEKQYARRDAAALDVWGGFYHRHVRAMTEEKLHGKAEIAAELGWRDLRIFQLETELEALKQQMEATAARVQERLDKLLKKADEHLEDVGRDG